MPDDYSLKVRHYLSFGRHYQSILCLFPHLRINMRVYKFSLKYTDYIIYMYFSIVGD